MKNLVDAGSCGSMLRVRRFDGRKGRTRKNNEDFEAWRLNAAACSFSTTPTTRRFGSFKRRQELCICGKAQSAQQMATRKLVVALGEARHSTSDYREKGTTSQPPWVRLLRRPRIRRGDVTLLLCTRKRKLVPGADAKRNSSPSSTAVVGALRLPTIFLLGRKNSLRL